MTMHCQHNFKIIIYHFIRLLVSKLSLALYLYLHSRSLKSSQYGGYGVLWNRIVWWMDTNISEEHSTSIFRTSVIPWRWKEQVSTKVFYRVPNCTVLQHRIPLSSCFPRFILARTSMLYSLSYWQSVSEPEIKVLQNTRMSVQVSDGWHEGFDF